jgi:hypothetical protein
MNSKPSVLRRIRQRLGSRGVAMVEGAVIFPVMAGFLVMLELAHHSFDAYITTGHVARERAWSSATAGSIIGNCPTARDDTGYSSKASAYFTIAAAGGGTDENVGKGAKPDPGPAGKYVPPDLPAQNGFFKHTETVTATVTVHRGQSPVYTKTTVSKDVVYCNQAWHGTIVDIIKAAL